MTNEQLPLVSVITVTYNSAKYVRDAIESVLAQTYINLEYIIGDDCSTDNTWDVIKEYTDSRIRTYRNEENLREYSNRNKAVKMATGKYIIFIDGDDVIYQHGISFFTHLMEQHPQAAFAIQKGYYNNIIFPALLSPEQITMNYFFGAMTLLTSSFVSNFFRTDILRQEGGLSTSYKKGDEEIRIRLACTYPVLLVPGWVTWPRETPGQASSLIGDSHGLTETYRIIHQLKDAGRFDYLSEAIIDKMMQKLDENMMAAIKKGLLRGKFSEARELKKISGLKWGALIKRSRSGGFPGDFMSDATPASPYKQHARKN